MEIEPSIEEIEKFIDGNPTAPIPTTPTALPGPGGAPPTTSSGALPVGRGRPARKEKLINDIRSLNPSLSVADLKKQRVEQLHRILGNLINRGQDALNESNVDEITKLLRPSAVPTPTTAPGAPGANNSKPATPTVDPTDEAGVEALYNATIIAASGLEAASMTEAARSRLGAGLDGWTEFIKNDKENFKIHLSALYKEYKEDIQTYISPMNNFLMYMAGSAAIVYQNNLKKTYGDGSQTSQSKLNAGSQGTSV